MAWFREWKSGLVCFHMEAFNSFGGGFTPYPLDYVIIIARQILLIKVGQMFQDCPLKCHRLDSQRKEVVCRNCLKN